MLRLTPNVYTIVHVRHRAGIDGDGVEQVTASGVEYEWDEAKRASNLRKHGIDFYDAIEVFGHPHLTIPSTRDGEERQVTLGVIGPLIAAVVWTDRGGLTRLISARVARRDEQRAYHARFGA